MFLRRSQKFLPPNSFAKFVIYNVRLPPCSNYFYKHTSLIINMHRARCALPYLPFHRSASVGRSLAGRPPGGGLLANVMRVRLCLRLAAAPTQLPDAASSLQFVYNKKRTVFNKRVRPLSACATLKNYSGRRYAKPLANSA